MKRNRLRSSLSVGLSIVLITTSFAGCATGGSGSFLDNSKQSALICGAGGAAVGAAAGAAIGGAGRRGSLTGALVGAGIGALVGAIAAATACFAIAEYRSQQVKTYDETKHAFNYQPSQGDVIQISRYEITPAAASPGTQVAFNATYYVMTPNPNEEVPITETRIVKVFDASSRGYRELGRTVNHVTVRPGTRQAEGKWEIRSGVAQGQYLVLFDVAKAERSDSKELALIVTSNQAVLNAASNRVALVEGTKAADPPPAEPKVAAVPDQPATSQAAASPTPQAAGASGTGAGASLAALGEQQPKAPTIATTAAALPTAATPPGAKSSYFLASKVVGRGNVREGPGAKHKIIADIQKAERFLVVDRVTNQGEKSPWFKIRLEDGREGWVAGSLGEEIQE